MLFSSSTSAARRRILVLAALLLAATCALALAWTETAPADPQEKLEQTRDKLEGVREQGDDLAATIAEQNRAIDAKLGEVSALRQEQEAVEAELAEKETELKRATAALEAEEEHLEQVRAKLQRAMGVLSERLVSIYESGSPDIVNAILESENWSDMAAQTEYLNRIQSYDDAVVERVKTLRDEVRSAVERLAGKRAEIEEARDEVAAIEHEVAAARQEAEARFAELKSAQAERREALEALESREEALGNNLAAISEQVASEGGDATTGLMPAPLNPGQEAQVISESEASAPSSAPQAVQDAIDAWKVIAGIAFDTVGGPGPRWHDPWVDSPEGFVARHPAGY